MLTSAASGSTAALMAPGYLWVASGLGSMGRIRCAIGIFGKNLMPWLTVLAASGTLETPSIPLIPSCWTSERFRWSLINPASGLLFMGCLRKHSEASQIPQSGCGSINQARLRIFSLCWQGPLFPAHLKRSPAPWVSVPCKRYKETQQSCFNSHFLM